jgi:hypothetical protein
MRQTTKKSQAQRGDNARRARLLTYYEARQQLLDEQQRIDVELSSLYANLSHKDRALIDKVEQAMKQGVFS